MVVVVEIVLQVQVVVDVEIVQQVQVVVVKIVLLQVPPTPPCLRVGPDKGIQNYLLGKEMK